MFALSEKRIVDHCRQNQRTHQTDQEGFKSIPWPRNSRFPFLSNLGPTGGGHSYGPLAPGFVTAGIWVRTPDQTLRQIIQACGTKQPSLRACQQRNFILWGCKRLYMPADPAGHVSDSLSLPRFSLFPHVALRTRVSRAPSRWFRKAQEAQVEARQSPRSYWQGGHGH